MSGRGTFWKCEKLPINRKVTRLLVDIACVCKKKLLAAFIFRERAAISEVVRVLLLQPMLQQQNVCQKCVIFEKFEKRLLYT